MKIPISLSRLNIGARLSLAFGLVLVLLILTLALSLNALREMQARTARIIDDHNVKVSAANTATSAIRDVAAYASNIAMLDDDAAMEVERRKLSEVRGKYGAAKALLTRLIDDDQGKELLAKLNASLAVAVPLNNQMIEMRLQHKNAEAIAFLMNKASPALRDTIVALDAIVSYETETTRRVADEAREDYLRTRNLLFALGAIAIILCAMIAWRITRSIKIPLTRALSVAEAVAAGDVSTKILSVAADETGRLLSALKKMNDNLNRIVGRVRSGAETIATASAEIAAGNRSLSDRTEQQAASLEETASSMEELTATVRQNADNARQANQLAAAASEVAVKGGDVVSQVVATMASINDSSRKVVDIIAVIDGIAFQTNILALNAAVEAARAGEQGRGFAVVASEVRALAQRSAGAAREIKTLIDDSVEKVGSGTKLVDSAGETMQEVVASVGKVRDIIEEIASASAEQTAGIEQIHQAVTQMDQTTQQNAALVEQASAASEALRDQAVQLTNAVSIFKLGADEPSLMVIDDYRPQLPPDGARKISSRLGTHVKTS